MKTREEVIKAMAEVLETLSTYPVLRGHADGPCLEKQDMKDMEQALADYREWKERDAKERVESARLWAYDPMVDDPDNK